MNFGGVPFCHRIANGNQVGGRCSQCDDRPTSARQKACPDEVVDFCGSLEEVKRGGGFVGQPLVAQSESANRMACSIPYLPAIWRFGYVYQLGAVSADVDHGQRVGRRKDRVIRNGSPAEFSLLISRENLDRCALTLGSREKVAGVLGDAKRHGSRGNNVINPLGPCKLEGVAQRSQRTLGSVGRNQPRRFDACAQASHSGRFPYREPPRVFPFGDQQEHGVRADIDNGASHGGESTAGASIMVEPPA